MLALIWTGALVRRRGLVLAMVALGIALAVSLLASIGAFVAHSKATMTRRAIATVAVDWQVEVQPGADAAHVAGLTRVEPGVAHALRVGFAHTTGLQAQVGGTTQTTGPGVVLGIPPGYATTFPDATRPLAGSTGGVLLAQQTAANLHARPGDTIRVGRFGLAPVPLRVDGIVDLLQADSLFQHIGGTAQGQAPPDNVVMVPEATWHRAFDSEARLRPDLVRTQLHVQLDRRLPSDPAAAYSGVLGRAHHLEANLAGAGLVGDNLAATLASARSDALYAQVLFVFLGLPGAVVAALLTIAVAGAAATRRRREQALMRARGATIRTVVGLAVAEAIVVGVAGAVVGLGGAAIVGRLAFRDATFGATSFSAVVWAAAAAFFGLVVAGAAIAWPAWRDARSATVTTSRAVVARPRGPRWMRVGVDLWLIALGALVFWLTSRNGYQLVLAPEGVPGISVSYWAFAGPALLWIGTGLLAWRVADLVLRHGRDLLGRALRPVAGNLSATVASSMSRQSRLLARSLVLLALTASFAATTAVFNATYRHQARVDAALTNGSDVRVTEPPSVGVAPSAAAQLARVPGVKRVESMQHRFAYVGADLQDLYGVDPRTIGNGGRLQDAYFRGGSARGLMHDLAARPDNILVSAETVHDYLLQKGDRITLRLQDARTHQYVPVDFHYAGIAKEFPTAPTDSFLVANGDYVRTATHSDAIGYVLVDTGGRSPSTIAARLRGVVGTGATVTDIDSTRRLVGSSLTAVDLAGLTKVELGYALAFAAAASGLVLWLGFAERRRAFAIAAALGARRRQLRAFAWSDALFVGIGGALAGAAGAWVLSHVLVKVLTGVFDPPPAGLSVPWGYFAVAGGVTVIAIVAGAVSAMRMAAGEATTWLRDG